MTKKSTRYLLLMLFFLPVCLVAWGSSIKPAKNAKSSEKKPLPKTAAGHIISFKITQQIAAEVIDETNHFIAINIHAGVPVNAITPTIILDQPGSTVTPTSGAQQDFSGGAIAYIVDGATYYSVNLFAAHTLPAICPGASVLIPGDNPTPAGTLLWQMLNTTTGLWGNAPNTGTNANPNYQTVPLSNATNQPKVYTFRRSITTGGTTYDSYYDITVNPSTVISGNSINQPANVTFCNSGDPGIITGNPPSGGIGSYSYQWQSSVNGGAFTDITGATGADYTPGTITATTSFQRVVTSGTCTAPKTSNKITITIQSPITNNHLFQPGTITFCVSSGPFLLQGSNPPAGGNGAFTYQWQSSTDGVNFADILTAAAKQHDYSSPSVSQTTYFRRMASSGACSAPVPSDNTITITIQQGLSNNNISANGQTTFCGYGDPGTIGGGAPAGGDGLNYTYKWQSSPDGGTFSDIVPAATGQTYTPGTVLTTTYFRRLVTSGSCTTPLPSNSVAITVQPPLSANTISVPSPATFCAVSPALTISGSAVTGGDGTPVYQWESSPDGTSFQPIANETGPNYDVPALTQTTWYRRGVSSGACNTVIYSNAVPITIQPPLSANTISIAGPTTFCAVSSALTINGSAVTGGDGTPVYQWESSTDGASYQLISGQTGQTYDVPALTQTTWYRRGVSSGACNTIIYSSPVTITIQQALAGNVITAPAVSSFCGSGAAGAITGPPPTGGDGSPLYQWQQSPDNIDAHFVNINGENGFDFTPPALTSTMFYRRVITELTCTTPLISNAVEIHITQPLNPNSNTINSPLITTFCTSYDPNTIIGSFGTDVHGNIPAGVDKITYQWLTSTDNGATWQAVTVNGNSPDYDPDPITTSTWYMRTIMSGACNTPVNSVQIVKLTIKNSPGNIKIDPAAPVCAGGSAVLSITAPDAALVYNWYDTPTRDNLLHQGPSFTAGPLTATQTFYAEASNGTCSSPALASVTVTVNSLPAQPVIDQSANPVEVCSGFGTPLKIVSPQSGITYNWFTQPSGGSPVFTGSEFDTPPVTAAVTYYAAAVNATGCVSAARTAVNLAPVVLPTVTVQPANVCPGDPATLASGNTDADVVINWYTAATGGQPVYTGNSFITPPVTVNTIYYAEAASNGCVSASRAAGQVNIIQPLPAPLVHAASTKAPDVTFAWTPIAEATGYLVSTDNGQTFSAPSSGSNGTTHTVSGLQVGQSVTLIVRATGNSSCELSGSSTPVTVVAINPLIDEIFVANAFTPNGDGRNDMIYVRNENIKSVKFYVYDQWGELLFTSQSQQKGWDGTFRGKVEPAGVYVYYLEAIMNDGQQVNKKGTITLLR